MSYFGNEFIPTVYASCVPVVKELAKLTGYEEDYLLELYDEACEDFEQGFMEGTNTGLWNFLDEFYKTFQYFYGVTLELDW